MTKLEKRQGLRSDQASFLVVLTIFTQSGRLRISNLHTDGARRKPKGCASFFMSDTTFVPDWAKHSEGLRADDETIAAKAEDNFVETRERELQTSQRARDYEAGRKEEWAKNKPEYVKKRNAIEKDPSKRTISKILDGGRFDTGIVPSPGLVMIKLDPISREINGIIVPISNDDTPNTGTIVEVGDELILENGQVIKFPHKIGDKVLIRKYSPNFHVTVKDEKYYFLQFNDVLGRFK